MKTGTLMRVAVVVVAMTFAASIASAQLNSAAQPIQLNANLAESLSVALSNSTVNFNLVAGSAANAGSTNVTATTSWVLAPGRTAVKVYAYFANSAAALTDGAAGDNIPSADFTISVGGGAATALTNSVAFGGPNAGLQLSNTAITTLNRNSNHADVMAFNINLSSLPQLPANTYTGTLNIQAQATP